MAECNFEVSVYPPGKWSILPFPLHGVGADTIDWSESHLVKLALGCHTLDVECESLAVLDALHTEVEPGVIVSTWGVR